MPYNNEIRRAIVDGKECNVIWLPEPHKAPPPYWRQNPNYKPEILRKSGWRLAIYNSAFGWGARTDRSGIVQPTEFLKD